MSSSASPTPSSSLKNFLNEIPNLHKFSYGMLLSLILNYPDFSTQLHNNIRRGGGFGNPDSVGRNWVCGMRNRLEKNLTAMVVIREGS